MARPFKSEMTELLGTLEWVGSADLSEVVAGLARARYEPIVAVGSGGSLSAAEHLARLHRTFQRRLSVAMTPYQFRSEPTPADAHCWIFSAGGSNVDVLAAVSAATRAEAASLNAVTVRSRSTLSRLAEVDPTIRMHCLGIPSKKDGFLATNSLLAFCAVMTRAYLEMNGSGEKWEAVYAEVRHYLHGTGMDVWRAAARGVAGREHLIVLHDADTSLGAFDLESKLTEAGVVGVQLADYRHFAHGRHHWLAKNADTSAVLAFTSDADRSLARRTLRLLPTDIAAAVIDIPGRGEAVQLASLLAAFCVTEELGFARGIDPGQPGVPDFGRKLYSLSIGKAEARSRRQVAIDRKASERSIVKSPDLRRETSDVVADAHGRFEEHLAATPLGGIVLDYDGTIVDTPDRFQPPRNDIAAELVRLVTAGLPVGIATGRGRSAGADLRAVIPRDLWSLVTVGYYNGAVLRGLDETQPVDDPDAEPSKDLVLVDDALQRDDDAPKATLRRHQLTLETKGDLPEERLWERVRSLVDAMDLPMLQVLRSSHSVDVLDSTARKQNVVEALATRSGSPHILRIGDRGRWPGNDHDLLDSPLGLSVDQVSPDLATCWNIAPETVRGSRAALYYLRSVEVREELGWLRLEAE